MGLWVTRLCDIYVRQQDIPLDRSLLSTLESSVNAKARLLHYFPKPNDTLDSEDDGVDDWCGEHVDHGSLTALLPGMISDEESSLQSDRESIPGILPPGLYIRTRNGETVHAKLSPTSLGFQVGETMSIQSRGRLQATPHFVKASPGTSRESLALFLQPDADEILPPLEMKSDGECSVRGDDESPSDPFELASRWRPTFGEFQRETIAYYN